MGANQLSGITLRIVASVSSLMPWPFVAVEERDPVPCGLTDFSWEVDGITKRRATVIYWLFTNGILGSLCHGL